MSSWDDPALTGALGDRIADDLRAVVRRYEDQRDRSQQTHIGPSQLGSPCTRCLARTALGMPLVREFNDPWCAIVGTATHAWLEEAVKWVNGADDSRRWFPEARVQPDPDLLPKGGMADLYDCDTGTVIDHKVVGVPRLREVRISGPGPLYRVQAHTYGLGFDLAGHDIRHVAIAFWPRGGRLSELYVWTEPYQPQVAVDALERWRTIRDQAQAIGPAILPHLPADPSCWDCGGKDVSAEELAVINNPAQTIPA